jgi:hypothetical protein
MMDPVDSLGDVNERRLNMRLMAYWQALRGEESHARVDHFDPDAVAGLWPHCFTIVPAANPNPATFVHVGDAIAADSGLPAGGLVVEDVPANTLLGKALHSMAEVLKVKYPIVDSGEFTDHLGRPSLYRSILLPLSDGCGAIALLVGGARCRVMSEEDDGSA